MNKIIILFLFLTSCSFIARDRKIIKYNNSEVEKEFIPAIKVFERACKKKVDLDIKFSTLNFFPVDAIGICLIPFMPFFIKRTIYIDKDWWDSWSQIGDMGEELILHELGHCVLNRGHTKDMHSYVETYIRPKSIMYPSIFGYWGWYSQNRKEYLKELCQEK